MNALHEYLGDEFCVGHSFIFTDVLERMDPTQWVSRASTGEDVYNFFLKKKWFPLTNLMYRFGAWYYPFRKQSIEPILVEYLKKYTPDLVLSVIPLVNSALLAATQKLNIPFLLIPTDLDATIALTGIKKPTYDKFYMAISYDNEPINETIRKAEIDPSSVTYTGFPVKKAFFEPHNTRAIKKEFDIPEEKPVILLLMGAQGSQDLYKFSKQLSKLPIPAHVIIAIGRSEELRKSLEMIQFPKHITTTIIGFTHRIPDLMAISDLFITKSGSVSFNEAIYSQLPMILDGTSGVLNWEQLNHGLVKKYGLGDIIKRYFRLPNMVTEIVSNKEKIATIKQHFKQFTEKNPEQEIKLLVKRILSAH
jgi:processive 1,2-diacylglycerol beta-glucosyltransferase